MNDTAVDATYSTDESVHDRIERVCADIDNLLMALRDQARQLKEMGNDER